MMKKTSSHKVKRQEKQFILDRIKSTDRFEKCLDKIYYDTFIKLSNEIDMSVNNLTRDGNISRAEANRKISKEDVASFKQRLESANLSPQTKSRLKSELRSLEVNSNTNKQTLLQKRIEIAALEVAELEEQLLNKYIREEVEEESKRQSDIYNLLLGLGLITAIIKSKRSSKEKEIKKKVLDVIEKKSKSTIGSSIAAQNIITKTISNSLLSNITNKNINKFISKQILKDKTSYKATSFSDRIWYNSQDFIDAVNENVRRSIRNGRNPKTWANDLKKYLRENVDNASYKARRLAVTETGNMQIQMQAENLLANGFENCVIICEPGACDRCKPLDGKVFRIKDLISGINSPMMHPWCKCSIAATTREPDKEI